jgi:hypothetical protein
MQQHECRLVGQAKIAAQGQGAFTLHFVAEHGDGSEVAFQGQFVRGEQRPASDREILAATLATEAQHAVRPAGLVSLYRTAGRAYRRAIGIGPAELAKRQFGFRQRHAEHLSEAQGLCRFTEEEVLGHVAT